MSGSAADTADTTPPTLLRTPENGTVANGVLSYTFSEAITLAADASVIVAGNGQPLMTIALTGNPAVTHAGATLAIQLPQALAYGQYYELQFSGGAIADLAGNPVDGAAPFVTNFLYRSPVAVNLGGTAGADVLHGSDLADSIDGGAGDDTLYGYDGNDLLYGGSDAGASDPGNDRLDGGGGNDRLYGEDGSDDLDGGDGDDLLDGGGGDDRLHGKAGVNTLRGGEGKDLLVNDVASATDLLDGGGGDDLLRGYAGNEYIGGAGDDTIRIDYRVATSGPTRVSGGDGRDWITLSLSNMQTGKTTVSGGAGIDTFIPAFGTPASLPEVGITDFTTGAGGDLIDIRSMTIGSSARNPFDDGSIRLLASGADTLFQVRQASGSYLTVLTLVGVAPAQVLRDNFVDSYNPLGGTVGLTLTGTDGAESLSGTPFDDTLNGLGGADSLSGGAGNDLLEGGDGDDVLAGGGGDDILRGGEGKDTLSSASGNDLLEGGAGNDRLNAEGGNHRLLGGAGDDILTLRQSSTAGDRYAVTMAGDAGNDTFIIEGTSRPVDVTASGGEGADIFEIGYFSEGAAITILDFGAADQLDLRKWVPNGFKGNPAEAAYLKAEQQGANVLIHIDSDGPASAGTAWAITLANLSLASLSAANFMGIFDPGGGGKGLNLTGTPGRDLLSGGALDDTIDGGDGDDRIDGGAGNDLLLGGDESLPGIGDYIFGGDGRDTLRGGAGDDWLIGGDGDDLLYGDAGDDLLEGRGGNDRLEGGAGNDQLKEESGDGYLSGGAGDDVLEVRGPLVDRPAGATLDGGDGNDRMFGDSAVKTVLGGLGDDEVTLDAAGSAANLVPLAVDLGEGNDRLIVYSLGANGRPLRVSGGAGTDTYQFRWSADAGPLATITDFQAGAGGDVLDVHAFYNGNHSDNPFGTPGYARLVQDGSHVLLQTDADGAAGVHTWTTRVVLENRRVADFTGANFTGNARPGGETPGGGSPGVVLTGTAADDVLAGAALDDVLRGSDGVDTLYGGAGADQLHGDGGNDFLFAGAGNDRLEGSIGNDVLSGEAGDDELLGGPGNDTLEDRLGNNILRGGEGDDQIHSGAGGSDQVFGEAGDDVLFIAGGGRFEGGEGHDSFFLSLDGAATATLELSGGDGRDSYMLSGAAPGATVTIADFTAGAGGDLLRVDQLVTTPSGNPFAPGGSLQFVQRGADTVLQLRVSKDGAASFQDVLTLRDVAKAALTRENILLDFDPQGGSFGLSTQGRDGADLMAGTVHEDTLRGGGGNDVLTGGGGYDVLDGGAGIDAAVFSGTRSQYAVERVSHKPQDAQDMVVSDLRPGFNEGKDRLLGIERLLFSDGAIALDTGADGIAGQAYRIYRAAFDRAADEGGLGFWIAAMDRGSSLADIAGGFVRSQEFTNLYGAAPSNAELVTRLYRNILDRDPEQAGYEFWLNALDRKLVDLPSLLAQFSESNENRAAVAELIANGVSYQPFGG